MSEFVLDLNDSVAAKLATEAPPAPVSVALDPNHETRQEATRRAVEAVGIAWPSTILPEGTALYDSGVSHLKADRARWRKLPDGATALMAVKAALAAEDRRDIFDVPVSELRLNVANGRLYRTGKAEGSACGYDPHSFRQLLAQIPTCRAGEAPRGFAAALLHLTGAERASILNARIERADKKVTLRTKLAHSGQRIVRAVLSERYADVSDLHVAEAIEYGLNGSAGTCKLDYKPGDSISQFEVLFPSEIPVSTFCVGDVHYAGVAVRNSETGQGAIEVRPYLMRAACANLTLALGEGVSVSIRHLGDANRVRLSMRAAIAQAVAQIEPMVAAIQVAAQERLSDVTAKSPIEIIAQLARKFAISETTTEAWKSTYERGYAQSPTTWGVTSALTEATQQTAPWWGAQAEDEEVAGKILYVGIRRALA